VDLGDKKRKWYTLFKLVAFATGQLVVIICVKKEKIKKLINL